MTRRDVSAVDVRAWRDVPVRQPAEELADQACDDQDHHHAGEEIGRDGERTARLPDAAQVAVKHQQHNADGDDRQQFGISQCRNRRGDGRRARGDLDRDRHHVVDEQRDCGDLGDPWTKVLPRHDVRAAGPGVDGDDLAVGQHDEGHHEQHDAGQRQDQRERGDAEAAPEQFDQDFLCAVGRGGDPVRREDAERQRLGQPLLAELLVDERRSEQAPFDRIAQGFA